MLAAAVTGPVTGVASNISGGVSAGLGVTGNAAMESAISAGVRSLIGKSSVALVNNQGDLGAALEELGSSSNLRSLATNMVTARLVTQATNTLEVPKISPGASVAENMAVAARRGVIEASIRVGAEAAFGAGAELLGRSRCGRG
ncbi:MAG TPA: DUF637 domain-containing protein [Pusillimonas sp.]|uniref:DUF637 domain-containing protein n=1 Tax=Pusillimonas sp. TaxID=3040095 RepID=UPI002B4B1E33|nr:DUF637 domain-containing protein [Pusillimonas sp.]HLU20475.1 DUF637 domain-containing protein [Pusillimonas sp.]